MDSNIKSTDTDDVLESKLSQEIKSDSILIDVRSFGEFDMCNIPLSINYPIDRINFDNLAKVVKEKNVQEGILNEKYIITLILVYLRY